jgi:hypothetical protein
MKKKKTIKLIFKRLILLLALGFITINNGYSQTFVNFNNLTKSLASDCGNCATGDSIDINNDGKTDLYVKIQLWQAGNGPHVKEANALLIIAAIGDSVAGSCINDLTKKTLLPGDVIGNNTDWNILTHPFYIEPGKPWECDCNCTSEKTTYIGLRFMAGNAVKFGCLKIRYTKYYYIIEKGVYMPNGNPLTIPSTNF